jgi:hypothetical protein
VRADDLEMVVTMAIPLVAKVFTLAARKRGPSRVGVLVPFSYRIAVLLGLLWPAMFGALTDSGPISWLADWKLHHLGLRSGVMLTGIQMVFASGALALLALLWIGKLREKILGPDRVAAALAAAAAKPKGARERQGPLRTVIVLLVAGGPMVAFMVSMFRKPWRPYAVPDWMGWGLAAGGLLVVVAAIFLARASKDARPAPVGGLS